MNQSVVVGRLVRDPELKTTDNGNSVTSVTLAVPRNYKNIARRRFSKNHLLCRF